MVDRISFSECMQKYSGLIGQKDHGRKIFLTYNAKKGWNIKKLNICQLFLRNVFGLYKSTHSKTIYRAWKREIGQTLVIDKNLAHICQKQLLKDRFIDKSWAVAEQPPTAQPSLGPVNVNIQPHIVTMGNTDVSQADVVCFAEEHRDLEFHKNIVKIINSHAREGDILLVEGGILPNLEKPNKWEHLKKGIELRTWESNVETLFSTLPSYVANEKKFLSLLAAFKEGFPQHGYTEQDVKNYELKLEGLRQAFSSLGKALNVPDKKIQQSMKILTKSLTVLSTKQLEGKTLNNPAATSYYVILFALEVLEEYLKMPEAYCTKEEQKILYKSIIPRNKQLMTNIQQWRKEGKRVWVDAGAAHLLRMPIGVPEATKEINQFLQKQRYAIITTPDLYQDSLKV